MNMQSRKLIFKSEFAYCVNALFALLFTVIIPDRSTTSPSVGEQLLLQSIANLLWYFSCVQYSC